MRADFIGHVWPRRDRDVQSVHLPLLNTLILLTSGTT